MPLTDIERAAAERALRAYCAQRLLAELRPEVEIVCRLEGRFAYIAERRPVFGDRAQKRDHDVAKFRFDMTRRSWELFWQDRNMRWHRFTDCAPARGIGELLPMVDADPIFYG